ncbi:MAG: RNA ligase (ATP) [Lachnospiraceae bacterium]|jgi:RNA ligase (TIGR02306 family)|nr:RNA ligase (ATP) [Lachnospiraceae bacterium]
MRNLASVQRIWKIGPIEGADMIELAQVLGWKLVTKKGEFTQGDLAVYFEIDSFLPIRPEFEFLRASSYRNTEWQGEGFRIKTIKLRGQVSQGLLVPLETVASIAPGYSGPLDEGTDLTEVLGVAKYDPPEVESSTNMGTTKGRFPSFVHKTDETRVQSITGIIDEMRGVPYYISTKVDGTSVTMYAKDGAFGVAGRNWEYKLDDDSRVYEFAKDRGIPEKLLSLGENIAVQGEFAGPGIQKNPLRLKSTEWFIFNVFHIDRMEYGGLDELLEMSKLLGVPTVPIEETGEAFPYGSVDELLARAEGNYPSGVKKEGIVIRPKTDRYSQAANGRMSFKVLNNAYLLKNG